VSRHARLSPGETERFAEMYRAGATRAEWFAAFPQVGEKHLGVFNGLITRLHLHRAPHPDNIKIPNPDHPALVEGRTLFPARVRDAAEALQVLSPGNQSAKLGDRVEKGAWRGMLVFSLSLEERATCPRACGNWDICYGNSMPFAWRYRPGADLVARLDRELAGLNDQHGEGFVVRLHQLGDFYSVEYVAAWAGWLEKYPALHVFGYTAWPVESPIGAAISRLTQASWARFAIRFSSATPGPQAAITLRTMPEADARSKGAVVCPVQTGKSATCATCAVCWSPAAQHRTIAFLAHGPRAIPVTQMRQSGGQFAKAEAALPGLETPSRVGVLGYRAEPMFKRHSHDWYIESPTDVRRMLDVVSFDGPIHDPCCGRGNIPRTCGERGYEATGSDIVDRGYGTGGVNFFGDLTPRVNIVSNPPYGRTAEQFVHHALRVASGTVAILVQLSFLEGQGRYRRLYTQKPPALVLVCATRPSMPPGDLDGVVEAKGGKKAYCWIVWQPGETDTRTRWLP
jgi:hypothetical protein